MLTDCSVVDARSRTRVIVVVAGVVGVVALKKQDTLRSGDEVSVEGVETVIRAAPVVEVFSVDVDAFVANEEAGGGTHFIPAPVPCELKINPLVPTNEVASWIW